MAQYSSEGEYTSDRGSLLRQAIVMARQFEYRNTLKNPLLNIGESLNKLTYQALELLICVIGKYYYTCNDTMQQKHYLQFIGTGRKLILTIQELQGFLNTKSDGADRNISAEFFEDCLKVLRSLIFTNNKNRLTYHIINSKFQGLLEWMKKNPNFTRDECRYAILCCFCRVAYNEFISRKILFDTESQATALSDIFSQEVYVIYGHTENPLKFVTECEEYDKFTQMLRFNSTCTYIQENIFNDASAAAANSSAAAAANSSADAAAACAKTDSDALSIFLEILASELNRDAEKNFVASTLSMWPELTGDDTSSRPEPATKRQRLE